MNRKLVKLLCIALIVTVSGPRESQAQGQVGEREPGDFGFTFDMSMARMSIDPSQSESEAIGQRGWSFIRMGGGMVFAKYFIAELGFGIFKFKDNDEFSQWVTNTGGQLSGLPRRATSEIISGEIYYGVGGSISPTKKTVLEMTVGQTRPSFTRTIALCPSCDDFDLEVAGGPYWQARIGYGDRAETKDRVGFAGMYLSYRKHFQEAQMDEMFLVGFMMHVR